MKGVLMWLLVAFWLLQGSGHGPAINVDWHTQADSLYRLGLSFSDERDDFTALTRYERALESYLDNDGNPDYLLGLLHNDMNYSYDNQST